MQTKSTGTPKRGTPVKPTCTECPAFVVERQQEELIGTNLGSPICGRKMLPLIAPRQSPDAAKRVLEHTATNCKWYKQEVRLDPLRAFDAPPLPVGIDMNPATQSVSDASLMADCMSCENYVSGAEVQRTYGWTSSLCRATGWLMPDGRLEGYAKKCGAYSRRNTLRTTNNLGTFTLLPAFSDTFGKINEAGAYKNSLDNYVDPSEYETDRPVSERAAKQHIRAWRRITDPDGYGEDVFLPIYDLKGHIADNEWDLVPQASHAEAPHLYADHGGILYTMAVLWMKLDDTPAAWGQGGVGKTELARHLAWLMQLPFHRIVINSASEIDDIAGKILFKNGQTVPHYGRLARAWKSPGVILLDEPNTGPADIWQLIRPLTDNSRLLVLDNLEGERIVRHEDAFFMMAMNPSWDPRNVGAFEIGDADSSRLQHIFFDLPPRTVEEEIIQRRVKLDNWEVPEGQLKNLMDVAEELRQLSNDGVLHTTWGVRHNIKAARNLRYFRPSVAYKRAAGDALEPSQWEAMHTVITSHFGD